VSAHDTVKASVCDLLQLSFPGGSKARDEEKNLSTESVGGSGDRRSGSASTTRRGAGNPRQLKGKARRGTQRQVGGLSPARQGPVAAWQAYGEANQRFDAEKRKRLADPPALRGEMDLARPFRDDVEVVVTEPPTAEVQPKGCGAGELRVAPHLRATRQPALRPPRVEPAHRPRMVVVEYITQDGVFASLDDALAAQGKK
jgi:hypothetical protein